MAFKIFAVLCLMNVGNLEQNLCFKSEVPLNFKNNLDCQISMNKLADYLDTDLKQRQMTLAMVCAQEEQKINI
tara:strand:+ start:118 stop:336 length:219 start_codon:yes stop_codon:yes gene_type:complete